MRIAKFHQGVVHQRMLDDVKRHGHYIVMRANRGPHAEVLRVLAGVARSSGLSLRVVWTQTGTRQVSLVVTRRHRRHHGRQRRVDRRTAPLPSTAPTSSPSTPPTPSRKQFRGAETIDATGQVVMPGLINTHTHAPMVLYRGLADDLALMEWLTKYSFRRRRRPCRRSSCAPAPGWRRSR